MPPQTFTFEGEEYEKKTVGKHSKTASVIYLPASWAGKKVVVILLPDEDL